MVLDLGCGKGDYAAFFDSRKSMMESWYNHNPSTYITLKKGTNIELFNLKIKDYLKTKIENTHQSLFIRSFSDKYLYGNYANGVQTGGRIEYVRLFTWIAIFILIIACINFMNMSTALASKKTKEIGIKKVVGSGKRSLVFHFLGESLVLVLISLITAIGIVLLVLPIFNTFTGKQLRLDLVIENLLFLFSLILITTTISGSYPSLYLTKFNPVLVLKGKLSTAFGESFIRKGLVIFQFSISIILILSSLVIYKQIKYIQTKNLGYNRNGIICLKKDSNLEENSNAFISEIKNISGVINASSSGTDLTGYHGQTTTRISYNGGEEVRISFDNMSVSNDFIETLGMKLKEGRPFSKDYGSEQSKIIFNESAIKKLGIKQPIGKNVHFWRRDWQIIGVVKDFNLESLHNEINPFFFQLLSPEVQGNNIWIKIKSGTEITTINQIKKIYTKFNPDLPFEYSFFDDDYQKMYKSENQKAVLSKYFSGIAILISCLGIFGLAAFTIRKRTKEIGIRKVNGSTAFGIVRMITGDFVTLVIISIVIAIPLGFIINSKWLSNFAYRTDIKWWIFLGSGLFALLIAMVTVGIHALKAANINPAICLKDE